MAEYIDNYIADAQHRSEKRGKLIDNWRKMNKKDRKQFKDNWPWLADVFESLTKNSAADPHATAADALIKQKQHQSSGESVTPVNPLAPLAMMGDSSWD